MIFKIGEKELRACNDCEEIKELQHYNNRETETCIACKKADDYESEYERMVASKIPKIPVSEMTPEQLHIRILKHISQTEVQQYSKPKRTILVSETIKKAFDKISEDNNSVDYDETFLLLINKYETVRDTEDLELNLKERQLCSKMALKYFNKDITTEKNIHGIHILHQNVKIFDNLKEEFDIRFNATLMTYLITNYTK